MCDKLVYDLSNEIEGQPNIFIRKDWISVMDNQNGNYSANQLIVDTSQLSNSNRWMSFREGYLSVPLLLTVASDVSGFAPATAASSADYCIGLKNWFGSIIHSMTLEFNGTSIVQQTPYCGMWNVFQLLTTLSWNDIALYGSTIGFYPDDPLSWSYHTAAGTGGVGVCNNTNYIEPADVRGVFNQYKAAKGNVGFYKRQTYINYDADASSGNGTYSANQLTATAAGLMWKSHISQKLNGSGLNGGIFQISVRATIYLKHIHNFFNNIPLLKGVFMRMTLNLNNSSCIVNSNGTNLSLTSSTVGVGGVLPFMLASSAVKNGCNDSSGNSILVAGNYHCSLSVGNTCLNTSVPNYANVAKGNVGNNAFLYVPSYVFNPIFENSYISSPVKTINFKDIYFYQVLGVAAESGTINNLLTNGCAGLSEVLVIPFYSNIYPSASPAIKPYQSPFDSAGTGTTSPLCLINNFNVVVSGQNAIYNTEMRAFEHFNNQFVGCNSVNGGLTDGLTSGLIDSLGFEMNYNYYYVNVGRALPVEESVPKSVQIVGQNISKQPLDLFCFVSYNSGISVDLLTGAKV